MRKRFFLLDADMTLFDFAKAQERAIHSVMMRAGIAQSIDNAHRFHQINEGLWRKLEKGELNQERLRVLRFEIFLEEMGSVLPAHVAADIFVEELSCGCFLFPQALSLLQYLHRHARVGILTNGITRVQQARLAASGLLRYLDAVVISQQEGVSKPDARIVQSALEKIGCTDVREAVIVGDSLTSDMQAAKNAGVDGIWYNPNRLPMPQERAHILCDIAQLHDLIDVL